MRVVHVVSSSLECLDLRHIQLRYLDLMPRPQQVPLSSEATVDTKGDADEVMEEEIEQEGYGT